MKEAFEKIKERLETIREEDVCTGMRCIECNKKYPDCDVAQQNMMIDKCKEIVSEVEAEYENDVCEWERIAINTYSNRTHAEIYGSRVLDWCACPYCGKKVKVVE